MEQPGLHGLHRISCQMDEPSMSKLVHDHEHGKLHEKVASAT
jgi:hypothetical protein